MPTTRTPKELKADIQKAVQILELFTDPNKGRDVQTLIPPSVLREAHGIVFIRLYRIGFMISAKGGTGIIIARLPDGSWSAPSGVSMSSVGFGHQAGGEVIDSIIVMNYRAAVKAFFDGGGQLQLGVGASLAVGPMGRAADISASAANTSHIAATYAYSASKGLYMGYSFEGSKISERVNTNAAYYGRPITARDILTGTVPPPQDAARLYDILNSLGAGPRPGLPFASQKSKRTQSMNSSTATTAGRPSAAILPPPVNYANRPPTTADGFEEPPPPYQPNESNDYHATSPPAAAAAAAAPLTTPTTKESSSFQQAYLSTGARSHQHHPTYQPSSSYQASYEPNDMDSKGKGANRSMSSSSPVVSPSPPVGTDIKKPFPLAKEEEEPMTVVVAKYDYHGDSPSDLQFSAGDHIIVIKRLEDRQSWWEGEIGTRRGFFPANYTQDLE
ncbi:hypothetical protein INT47_004200 [Mucor saturninus]|uniref:SH3 domain-containing protein n=1 Tax=Mucor saturninus TaxID=64648 RepID=A0A8H7QM31_9FUNG|nr:hypothetical protein INT47_004200 [Mucor saturninus]